MMVSIVERQIFMLAVFGVIMFAAIFPRTCAAHGFSSPQIHLTCKALAVKQMELKEKRRAGARERERVKFV
jgi:hypothetical protein